MSADIVFVPSHPIIRSNYFLTTAKCTHLTRRTHLRTHANASCRTHPARTHARTHAVPRTHARQLPHMRTDFDCCTCASWALGSLGRTHLYQPPLASCHSMQASVCFNTYARTHESRRRGARTRVGMDTSDAVPTRTASGRTAQARRPHAHPNARICSLNSWRAWPGRPGPAVRRQIAWPAAGRAVAAATLTKMLGRSRGGSSAAATIEQAQIMLVIRL